MDTQNINNNPNSNQNQLKIDYSNGDTYYGSHNNKVKEGFGELRTAEGDIIRGQWRQNQLSGFGQILYSNGKRFIGSFLNGERHGIGMLEVGTKVYKGEYQNGKRTGFGQFQAGEQELRRGEFKDGAHHGYGEVELKDKSNVYKGMFIDGKPEGLGSETTPYDLYLGNFKAGRKNGIGSQTLKDGMKYSGSFNMGTKNGFGIQKSPDGYVYIGEFSGGQWEGLGRLSNDKENFVYTGEFSKGEFHGFGKMQTKTNLYIGTWNQSKEEGLGYAKELGSQESYFGHWKEGLRAGVGYESGKDNDYKGEFKDDQRHGRGFIKKGSDKLLAVRYEDGKLVCELGEDALGELKREFAFLKIDEFFTESRKKIVRIDMEISERHKELQGELGGLSKLVFRENEEKLDRRLKEVLVRLDNLVFAFEKEKGRFEKLLNSRGIDIRKITADPANLAKIRPEDDPSPSQDEETQKKAPHAQIEDNSDVSALRQSPTSSNLARKGASSLEGNTEDILDFMMGKTRKKSMAQPTHPRKPFQNRVMEDRLSNATGSKQSIDHDDNFNSYKDLMVEGHGGAPYDRGTAPIQNSALNRISERERMLLAADQFRNSRMGLRDDSGAKGGSRDGQGGLGQQFNQFSNDPKLQTFMDEPQRTTSLINESSFDMLRNDPYSQLITHSTSNFMKIAGGAGEFPSESMYQKNPALTTRDYNNSILPPHMRDGGRSKNSSYHDNSTLNEYSLMRLFKGDNLAGDDDLSIEHRGLQGVPQDQSQNRMGTYDSEVGSFLKDISNEMNNTELSSLEFFNTRMKDTRRDLEVGLTKIGELAEELQLEKSKEDYYRSHFGDPGNYSKILEEEELIGTEDDEIQMVNHQQRVLQKQLLEIEMKREEIELKRLDYLEKKIKEQRKKKYEEFERRRRMKADNVDELRAGREGLYRENQRRLIKLPDGVVGPSSHESEDYSEFDLSHGISSLREGNRVFRKDEGELRQPRGLPGNRGPMEVGRGGEDDQSRRFGSALYSENSGNHLHPNSRNFVAEDRSMDREIQSNVEPSKELESPSPKHLNRKPFSLADPQNLNHQREIDARNRRRVQKSPDLDSGTMISDGVERPEGDPLQTNSEKHQVVYLDDLKSPMVTKTDPPVRQDSLSSFKPVTNKATNRDGNGGMERPNDPQSRAESNNSGDGGLGGDEVPGGGDLAVEEEALPKLSFKKKAEYGVDGEPRNQAQNQPRGSNPFNNGNRNNNNKKNNTGNHRTPNQKISNRKRHMTSSNNNTSGFQPQRRPSFGQPQNSQFSHQNNNKNIDPYTPEDDLHDEQQQGSRRDQIEPGAYSFAPQGVKRNGKRVYDSPWHPQESILDPMKDSRPFSRRRSSASRSKPGPPNVFRHNGSQNQRNPFSDRGSLENSRFRIIDPKDEEGYSTEGNGGSDYNNMTLHSLRRNLKKENRERRTPTKNLGYFKRELEKKDPTRLRRIEQNRRLKQFRNKDVYTNNSKIAVSRNRRQEPPEPEPRLQEESVRGQERGGFTRRKTKKKPKRVASRRKSYEYGGAGKSSGGPAKIRRRKKRVNNASNAQNNAAQAKGKGSGNKRVISRSRNRRKRNMMRAQNLGSYSPPKQYGENSIHQLRSLAMKYAVVDHYG